MRYPDGFSCLIKKSKVQVEVTPAVAGETVQNYIETIRDVTRFENLHTQLRRSERLAAIGTTVAGIAHEMNNPLSGISGNSQLMLKSPAKYGLNEKGENRVLNIFNSTKRATQIVNDLLEFSKPSGTQFRRLELKSLFTRTQARLAQNNSILFPIENSFPSERLFVWGNKNQLESVLEKILLNGVQAIQEKQQSSPKFKGSLAVTGRLDGKNIIAEIRDNGCGISEDNLASLFDPFFTTKDPGKGVGLGLSLCHRIISEHFGSIKLKRLKEGTLVQIYFPVDKPKIA
jgi:signal transduction histidine kinase